MADLKFSTELGILKSRKCRKSLLDIQITNLEIRPGSGKFRIKTAWPEKWNRNGLVGRKTCPGFTTLEAALFSCSFVKQKDIFQDSAQKYVDKNWLVTKKNGGMRSRWICSYKSLISTQHIIDSFDPIEAWALYLGPKVYFILDRKSTFICFRPKIRSRWYMFCRKLICKIIGDTLSNDFRDEKLYGLTSWFNIMIKFC